MSDAERRWEEGIPHHPMSEKLLKHMKRKDTLDEADLRTGGDGDMGETLMYLMDSFFEEQDEAQDLREGIQEDNRKWGHRLLNVRLLIAEFDAKSKASQEEPRTDDFWDLINAILAATDDP